MFYGVRSDVFKISWNCENVLIDATFHIQHNKYFTYEDEAPACYKKNYVLILSARCSVKLNTRLPY